VARTLAAGKCDRKRKRDPSRKGIWEPSSMILNQPAWRGRAWLRSHLLGVLAVLTAATAFDLSMRDPVRADDGSLETQKGGLFHRKGWISPEIYRAKPKPRKTARTRASKTARTRGSRISRDRRRATSHVKRRAAKRAIPRDVVERREHQITRSTKQLSKAVRVASLTTTVPSTSAVTGPELSIMRTSPRTSLTGGFLRINWRANRRCLAARLRATINHVARHYGRVRVISTCRSRRHNRRVGGARQSYHIGGRAADIRVFGNVRAAARYLRRASGGYKHYGGGRFHVDTGPKRTW
jgi:hypothetical protein